MNAKFTKTLVVIMLFGILVGCHNIENNLGIVHKNINKEYVLIQDKTQLQSSNDEISNYIDSIIDGLIQADFISTGNRSFNLVGDSLHDIGFEIIDLRPLNPSGFPSNFDTLAARVIAMSVEIRDNSTYGYCDALSTNDIINETGNWTNNTCVLGTFMNAGQFQGQGEKHLAFRFWENAEYKYGWIKIYCSQHSDTLRIIDYAYNSNANSSILAGQTE